MKRPEDYLEHTFVNGGFFKAVDVRDAGSACVVSGSRDGITGRWEYQSISAAMGAWLAWNPLIDAEPAGYERRIEGGYSGQS